MNIKLKKLLFATMIAALYVVLCEVSALFGLSSGIIQVRISEMLNVFAWFTPYAIPGLFVGCIIANMLTGAVVFDVIFGSIATLLGACGVYLFRKHRVLSLLCPFVTNMIIVPLVLKYAYGFPGSLWYFSLTVGVGQLIACTVLGYLFGIAIEKRKIKFF